MCNLRRGSGVAGVNAPYLLLLCGFAAVHAQPPPEALIEQGTSWE
jgi:hypothetical protein